MPEIECIIELLLWAACSELERNFITDIQREIVELLARQLDIEELADSAFCRRHAAHILAVK